MQSLWGAFGHWLKSTRNGCYCRRQPDTSQAYPSPSLPEIHKIDVTAYAGWPVSLRPLNRKAS
eukprot:1144444-Alexandrium_andersonii.AAC.1